MITPTHIVFANCGDSRAILAGPKGECLAATFDHKPDNPEETNRILNAGGSVTMKRVNGDLAVSRALGDFVYKQRRADVGTGWYEPEGQQVSCVPEVTIIERDHAAHAFVVLCCDGIWDVMTNEQVAKLMITVRPE